MFAFPDKVSSRSGKAGLFFEVDEFVELSDNDWLLTVF
jgi:hypothetical protein